MKLVDILARELKEWPEGLGDTAGQARDGTLHSENDAGPILRTDSAYTLCDDWIMDVVTRAQWQAAVEALKAEAAPAWSGVGLPPVGAKCIITPHNTIWGFSSIADYQGNVLSYHDDFVWVDLIGVSGVPIATRTDKVDFKPIRTQEQIAAEEHEHEVELAIQMINQKPFCPNSIAVQNGIRHAVGEMIAAGYRKFEIVDKDDGEGEV